MEKFMTMDHSSANTTIINFLSTSSYVTLVSNENVLETSNRSNSNTNVWFISNTTNIPRAQSVFESQLMIPLYITIFILSVVGNALVLFTLIRNKKMRTVTNVYLLNLAVADLLLGVFCMPFTLVGQVLRNFIFGATMCKLIPYFQAVSVSVAVWTLVAISLERYFAICRPLKSRRWQTRNHASKMIAFVWIASLIWSGPIMLVSTLQLSKRGHKCRESWPSKSSEQMFNLFLDVILLLVPLGIMSMAYFMIMEKLWRGLQREIEHNSCQKLVIQRSSSSPNLRNQVIKTKNLLIYSDNGNTAALDRNVSKQCSQCQLSNLNGIQERKRGTNNCHLCVVKGYMQVPVEPTTLRNSPVQYDGYNSHSEDSTRLKETLVKETTYTFARHGIRSNFMDRSIEAKRKVIRMLFVIVAEFFICWAPLHILNTWYLFYPKEVYDIVGSTGVSLVQLLAYISSCSNPITYCFMNRKFRQTFFTAFKCRRPCLYKTPVSTNDARHRNIVLNKKTGNISENSCNDSTLYVGRISYTGRSEPEAEDRV